MPHPHIFSYQLPEHPRSRPRRTTIVTATIAGVLVALLAVVLLGAVTEPRGGQSPSPVTGRVQAPPSVLAPATTAPSDQHHPYRSC